MAQANEVDHGWMLGKTFTINANYPKWKNDLLAREAKVPYNVGDVVKVVMVSRFGDCGITRNLQAEHGYDMRVEIDQIDPLTPDPQAGTKVS